MLDRKASKISKKESEELASGIKSKLRIPDGIDFKASPYEDSELIGRGQFGIVWRCVLKEGSQKEKSFAIKKLPWDPSDVEQISEILIHNRLKHANIIALHEVFSTHSMVLHIVMDLCDSDLEKYLADPSKVFALFNLSDGNSTSAFPCQTVTVTLFPMILEAVSYVHANNTIHRDIKPANILLRFTPESASMRCTPLLADFGLAKYLTSVSQRAKSYRCSPFWSAPELWSPLGGVIATGYTKAVDVWSLGIVLLQMWLGLASGDETIQTKVHD